MRTLRLARFGDNMRDVAVTEGDKVEAELRLRRLGQHLGRQRPGGRRRRRRRTPTSTPWSSEYEDVYDVAPELRAGGERHESLRYGAAHRARPAVVPRGRRLHRLHHQLRGPRRPAPAARPRRAAPDGRRLRLRRRGRLEDLGPAARAQGHGRRACPAARPSWRTTPTTSTPGEEKILGAHMLEVCPTIAAGRPTLEIHPLGHRRPGGPGPAGVRRRPRPGGRRRHRPTCGDRFRLVANEVEVVDPDEPLPKLPVARAVWKPAPDLRDVHRGWLHGRRPAPHRAVHRADRRAPGGLRRDGRHRARSSSTPAPRRAASPRSCAGTRPTTGSRRASEQKPQTPHKEATSRKPTPLPVVLDHLVTRSHLSAPPRIHLHGATIGVPGPIADRIHAQRAVGARRHTPEPLPMHHSNGERLCVRSSPSWRPARSR